MKPASEIGTWHSPQRQIVRSDNICLSEAICPTKHSCYTDPAFNTGGSGKDHIPMRIEVAMQCVDATPVLKRRVPHYDHRAVEMARKSSGHAVIHKVRMVDEQN